jgi:DNA repair exonuclease SbcCD ATPase subunit
MRVIHNAVVVAMGKDRKTFSLDERVVEELEDETGNASAVVNDLLQEWLLSGGDGPIGKEIKLRDIESKLEEAKNERDKINRRIERLRNNKRRIEQQIEQQQEEQREKLQEAAQYVKDKPVDNPAVENWAEKLNMAPSELKKQVAQL